MIDGETFGGAMKRFFGEPPEPLNLEARLRRDMAMFERDMKRLRRKSRKRTKGRRTKSNRTMKHCE